MHWGFWSHDIMFVTIMKIVGESVVTVGTFVGVFVGVMVGYLLGVFEGYFVGLFGGVYIKI